MSQGLPSALAKLGRGVTRARLLEGGVSGGRALGERVLLELGAGDAERLVELLAVEQPPAAFHCMCRGDHAVELWAGGALRATVGLHHGRSVRVEGWWSDAMLREPEALLRWLAGRGVEAPLRDWLAAQEAQERAVGHRRAWLEAAPAVLRPRLAVLEEGPLGMPRHLGPDDADAREALAAARAALGPRAEVALLGWFGSGAGPWSGYPAYEQVAEVLLEIVGAEPLIAAVAGVNDEAVLIGLARFLGRHDAPPRERALAGDDLRETLRQLVDRRCDDDARARFAYASRGHIGTLDAGRIGDAAFSPTFDGLSAAGDRLVALDGDRLVRFDRGSARGVVLAALPSRFAEIAADAASVVITLINEGEVLRVPIGGGALEVIARAQDRPMCPVFLDGRAAWLEQSRISEGVSTRTSTRIRLEGRAEPVYEHEDNAWDLLACAGALSWARHGGSLLKSLFGANVHRADVMRWDPRTGRVDVVAEVTGGEDGISFPRLSTDGAHIAWTSGRRVGLLEPRTGEKRELSAGGEVQYALPHGGGALAAVVEDQRGELVLLDPGGGRRVLSRWARAPWERERVVVAGGIAAWNAGEHLFGVPA